MVLARDRQAIRRAGSSPAVRTAYEAGDRDARQHLRSGNGSGNRFGGSCGCYRSSRGSLHPAVQRRRQPRHPALAVRDPGKPDSRFGASPGDDGVFLLDSMVDGDEPPEPGNQLHQQLAVRTAGGQCPDDADLPVDLHQHPRPAGRRGCAHLVLRRDARQGARARDPRQRSARRPEADAIDEGDRQVSSGW